ncbi:hypothetical protein [Homoserinimonas sp. OAct 916]|uniref:hypothetical protein n=1 Tax=Homoserinimonas sp. OAct 916 TaxID=2211450 RepID=UPI000DBE0C72|nr:hypothetical protein [Homoserinimonas sp. OAct 916]
MTGSRFTHSIRLLSLVAALGLLVGCAPAQAPGANGSASPPPEVTTAPPVTPTAEPSPDPTEAADPLTTVTRFVVRPDVLELRDADGQLVEKLGYMGPADEAVAMLTTVFGVAPEQKPYSSTNRSPGGVQHLWDYFVLNERKYEGEFWGTIDPTYLVQPHFSVYFDGVTADDADEALARDIELVTVQGHRVGDDWTVVSGDPAFDPGSRVCSDGTAIEVLDFVVDEHPTSVAVVVSESGNGTVKSISAPQPITTGGCV